MIVEAPCAHGAIHACAATAQATKANISIPRNLKQSTSLNHVGDIIRQLPSDLARLALRLGVGLRFGKIGLGVVLRALLELLSSSLSLLSHLQKILYFPQTQTYSYISQVLALVYNRHMAPPPPP